MQNSSIKQIQVDGGCSFNRIIVHSFGHLLVFIFYTRANQQQKQFLQNINNSIPIFGQFDNVEYYSLSAQKCPQTFKKFKVQKTPCVIYTQNDRKIIDRYEEQDIGIIFEKAQKIGQQHRQKFENEKIIWHPKVKSVLQSCPFLVFIKGTPENPKCGFTRSLLQILKNHNIQYTYYDISQDGQMGDWVRDYSKWKTFPQVYINGRLIGGLDVTKQLIQKGQFQKMIPESCKQSPPSQRYNKFITQHQNIIFVDGFDFQNENSKRFIQQARKKYGENVTVYNINIQKAMKDYITSSVHKQGPFVVSKQQIVKN